jgi:acyl carrier protein
VEASAFFLLRAELHLYMTMSMAQCANLTKSLIFNFFLTTFSILINSMPKLFVIFLLILMFQDDKHHDELDHFADDEPLDSFDRDELIKKITKSFGIELIKIEKVVKKKLNINDLVKLAHCAIDIVIYKCN